MRGGGVEGIPVVLAVDAVTLVERVDEGPLQPVRQHGQEEPGQVDALEAGLKGQTRWNEAASSIAEGATLL